MGVGGGAGSAHVLCCVRLGGGVRDRRIDVGVGVGIGAASAHNSRLVVSALMSVVLCGVKLGAAVVFGEEVGVGGIDAGVGNDGEKAGAEDEKVGVGLYEVVVVGVLVVEDVDERRRCFFCCLRRHDNSCRILCRSCICWRRVFAFFVVIVWLVLLVLIGINGGASAESRTGNRFVVL